jgi:hypothetical protein
MSDLAVSIGFNRSMFWKASPLRAFAFGEWWGNPSHLYLR